MINYEYAELFQKDSIKKELILDFGDFQITNEKLYSESFELSESLCSQEELKFGCCEASEVKFKCRNEFGDLRGRWFDASLVLNGNTDNPFQIGKYKVYSSTPSGDKKYTNVVAYDVMYDILNTDVAEWYAKLTFPITLYEFRRSFLEHIGVEPEISNPIDDFLLLAQDEILIEKTIESESISGKLVIESICELNGVFGHISRQGKFKYISLAGRKIEALYPSILLFPSDYLYPRDVVYSVDSYTTIQKGKYRVCKYEDFETRYISNLQIRQEAGDIGAIVNSDEAGAPRNYKNDYVVENNFLVYGKSSDELQQIASNLMIEIFEITYRPFSCELRGNPCIEVGDYIRIKTQTKEIHSYVLQRSLKGIQSLFDSFSSKGTYIYPNNPNSVQNQIKQLRGKTNVLNRTVERTLSEISDLEKETSTKFEQTAESLSLKVNSGDVISEINASSEGVKISGEKISLEGTVTANEYFSINSMGAMRAPQGWIGPWFFNDVVFRTEDFKVQIYLQEDLETWNIYNTDGLIWAKELVVTGEKQRAIETKSYDIRRLYSYEMPSPMFGDIGHGVIGEDGLCYVDMDLIFGETVDTVQNYQVFLQSYSEHNVYVYEKTQDYFVVKGEPNTEFDWEIKAKQIDLPINRLEQFVPDKQTDSVNYVKSAEAYLRKYEMEVLGYE